MHGEQASDEEETEEFKQIELDDDGQAKFDEIEWKEKEDDI